MPEVWVYRNLKHGRKSPKLYSVMRHGRVIRRVGQILLKDCRFVVREGGRQRALQEGRKNVHAFVVGTPVPTEFDWEKPRLFDWDKPKLPAKLSYRPQDGPHFMWNGRPVKTARTVLLNGDGISAADLE